MLGGWKCIARDAKSSEYRTRFSTGCTKHCGNVDYSKSAKCGFFRVANPCTALRAMYIPTCAERAAEVGRSSTAGPYEEVRKGRDRKVRRCCERNRKRLGESSLSAKHVAEERRDRQSAR